MFIPMQLDLLTKGGLGAFIGVCLVSRIVGVASAHTEGGCVGDLSLMCPEFIQSFSGGMAATGVLTSTLRIVTSAAFENAKNGLRTGALMFFGISVFFQLLCILLYALVLPKLPIVRSFRLKAASERSKTVLVDLAAVGASEQVMLEDNEDSKREILSSRQLLAENKAYAVNLFLVYAQTLSIFPRFLSEDIRSHRLGSWYPLVLIAIYNVSDFLGWYVPMVETIKIIILPTQKKKYSAIFNHDGTATTTAESELESTHPIRLDSLMQPFWPVVSTTNSQDRGVSAVAYVGESTMEPLR